MDKIKMISGKITNSIELSEKLNVRNVALCAYKLEFVHPVTKKKTEFKISPKGKIFEQFLPDLS